MADWQPIETCPKDGTKFLAICTDASANCRWAIGRQGVDYWHSRENGDEYEGLGQFNDQYWPASHWMPLPEPPK